MLENKELEAVIISTPLHEHFRMAMDALDVGVHIMCKGLPFRRVIKKREFESYQLY